MRETALELKNISVNYGANQILREFSLTVGNGELIALLGASGCGKTTALKAVAGLIPTANGEIWLNGENISDKPAARRQTALVFQKPLLFPFLNVAENVGFGLKMRKTPAAEIKLKVAAALQMVKLEGFENRRPKQLSGGQEQRVALARALVTNPQVLLLDEPFSALDAKLRVEMRNLVRDLQKNLKLTTLFVTHDQDEAVAVADRIAFVNRGLVEQCSAPAEFFTNPQTVAAAEFFGWKVVRGEIKNNHLETEIGNFDALLIGKNLVENQIINCAFHPSAVRFDLTNAANADEISLRGKLTAQIALGSRLRYTIRLANGELLESETNDALTIKFLQTASPENVNLKIPCAAVKYF